MSEREKLKMHIKYSTEEKRIELENFIDNILSKEDLKKALNYLDDLNKTTSHRITEIKYSEEGDLSIQAETGLTFLK